MSDWVLAYDGLVPAEEGLREALCTLGNGYFATRGAAEEASSDGVRYPGTYLAGGYNRLRSQVAGREIDSEDLVNFPNWLCLRIRVDGGPWFDPLHAELLRYRLCLDLENGTLERQIRFRDAEGRETSLSSRRLVSMADPHYAAIEMRLEAENWSGTLEIRSTIDSGVTNSGVARYRELAASHLQIEQLGHAGRDVAYSQVRTIQSALHVALAARTRAYLNDDIARAPAVPLLGTEIVGHDLQLTLRGGQSMAVEKIVALHCSRDHAIADCRQAACEAVTHAPRFEALWRRHRAAWHRLWRRADIRIVAETNHQQRVVRLHLFHLMQTASPHSRGLDVGVPARGLHGEAYRGHIFWDELFIFPFYNFHFPALSRSLLLYRYRRLNAARTAAAEAGLRGALFPWQSASDGREESQRYHLNPNSGHWIPDESWRQRHVNAAIAYNVWHYYQTTRDLEFLSHEGGEMVLEIARLFASLVTHDAGDDRYDLRGVVGPDEYHDRYLGAEQTGLDNNTYTNVMAAWTLQFAIETLQALPDERRTELTERVELEPDELELWDHISRRMRVVFHADGILSQFEGYESLEEFDWDGYRRRYQHIQRLDRILEAEGDTPNRYKLSKQADVLMLFYLFSSERLTALFERLGYEFDPQLIPATIDYYEARTAHGSTLSRVVHSWVLARRDRLRAWQHLNEALASDINDVQLGTTAEGIHLGAMAATVDVLQRCYTGCEILDGTLRIDPCLPNELQRLEQTILYQGNTIDIAIEDGQTRVRAGRRMAQELEYRYREQLYRLAPGNAQVHHREEPPPSE